jgi:methyl coenzyme M reductase subunit D
MATSNISDVEMEKIKKEVEKEFPFDYALQQVHIARKRISINAKKKGISYFEYLKEFDKQYREHKQ